MARRILSAFVAVAAASACRDAPPPPVAAAEVVIAPASASAPSASPVASASASAVTPAPGASALALPSGVVPRIEIDGATWRLVASVHRSLPPHVFVVSGEIAPGGRNGEKNRVVVSAPARSGPKQVTVERAPGTPQLLNRGVGRDEAFQAFPIELDVLELATAPTQGVNVGAGDLALADYDGDGYLDLELHVGKAYKYHFNQVWLFNPKNGLFEELVEVRSLPNTSLQPKGCIVSNSWWAGGQNFAFFEVRRRRLASLGSTAYEYYEPDGMWESSGPFRCSNLPKGARMKDDVLAGDAGP